MVSKGCKSSVSSLLSPIFQSSKGVKHAPHSFGKDFSTVNKTGKRSVGILGVPINRGQTNPGVLYGPAAIREGDLIKKIKGQWHEIHDHGDLGFDYVPEDDCADQPLVKNSHSLGRALQKTIVSAGEVCIVVGGDHSLSTGSIHGHSLAEPDICLLWIDAHADINLPMTSPSGNMHGMVLSFCVKELREYMPQIPGLEWLKPTISAKNIAFIGLRDLDAGEKYIIDQLNMTAYSIHDVDKHGLPEVLARSMDAINPRGNRPIHLSFDVDSLDPSVTPSTGTRVAGGLTFREGMYIVEEVANTGMMSAMDLVEVNPTIGTQADKERTIDCAIRLVGGALGKKREGEYPQNYQLPTVEEFLKDKKPAILK
ncbi:hypothetical protein BSL78_07248 [Apostichopus japonicus]|uniref:Arginase n=1 Tax=Stichopus japonicus TaxID=307972 RepID=A0A2G8L6H2_STIJA|nr:hypothetical protein BSL78_07248 [Apostichopus japonicus]